MEERKLRIEEVAMLLDVNQMTIERWYKFKRQNPDNESCKLLPDPEYGLTSKKHPVRYWKASDVEQMKEFQATIIRGTRGFMGSVSNPNRKKGENKNGKKKVGRNRGSNECRHQDAKSAKVGKARKQLGRNQNAG